MSRFTDFFNNLSTIAKMAATSNGTRQGQNIRKEIIDRYKDYTLKTIKRWRNAQQSAENEDTMDRRTLLHIYDDVMLDSHLTAQIETRIARVLGAKFSWVDEDNESDPEVDDVFKRAWFEKLVRAVMMAKFRGFGVVEIEGVKNGEITNVLEIPQNHVNRKYQVVERIVGANSGFSWNDPKYRPWLIPVGELRDLGLLLKASPLVLYKKSVLSRWSEYTEIFGHPYRVGRVNAGNDGRKLDMAKTLANMGSAAWGVFEQGESVEFIASSTTDVYNVYDQFVNRVNSELSKLITGQTMTADDGSSLSQSQVHASIFDDLTESDLRHVEHYVNTDFKPILVMHGYRVENLRYQYSRENELGLEESWKIHEGILAHYKIDRDWMAEKYGVPLEDKPAPVLPPALGGGGGSSPDDDDDGPGKTDPSPAAPEARGKRSGAPTMHAHSPDCCDSYRVLTVLQGESVQPTKAERKLLRKIFRGDTMTLDSAAYIETRNQLASALQEGFGSVPFTGYQRQDVIALRSMQANVFRFGWDKSASEVAVLNKLATQHTKFADFEKEAAKTLRAYNKHYLRAEYEFTASAAQNARAWVDIKTTSQYWRYSTVGDGNVRPEHAALDGMVFAVDDPEAARLVPPNGWNCRCLAAPADKPDQVDDMRGVEMAMGEDQLMKHRDKGFLVNRAELGDIFTANQRYAGELGLDIADIESATYEVYGKKPYAQLVKNRREFEAIDATTKELRDYFAANQVEDGVASFVDATGLPVFMTRDTLERHLTGGLVLELEKLSDKTDEAYMTGNADQGARYTFLSFYGDGAVRTRVSLEKGKDAEVTDIDFLEGSLVDQVRQGILIK